MVEYLLIMQQVVWSIPHNGLIELDLVPAIILSYLRDRTYNRH